MTTVGARGVWDAKRRLFRRIGGEIRQQREDAGLSQAAIARAARVNQPYLSRIEGGTAEPSVEVLIRIGMALGADRGVRYFANTGPRIRDHLQVAMGEELLRALHPRWRATPEVPVYRPVHGVIDVVLEDRDGSTTIETEIHGQMRRLEQQVRWQAQKTDALAALLDQQGRTVSRLLVLRNTQAMRDVVKAGAGTLGAAYPAPTAAAVAALRADGTWPGSAVVWMAIEDGRARLLDAPPRAISVGR